MECQSNSHIVYACSRGAKKCVAAPGFSEDKAEVAAMPEQLQPRRAGPILANYLKQREQDHQTILQTLSEDAAKLNAEIDAGIRVLAENLRSIIQQNQTDIKCVVDRYNITDNPLIAESRDKELENVKHLACQRVEQIEIFKREALVMERKRAEGLRTLMKNNFHRLVKVGHQTPKDILHYFDERAYEANQQILSNYRAYSELEARLCAQTDASKVCARSSLNQLYLQLSVRRRSSRRSTSTDYPNRASFSASDAEHRDSLVPSFKSILGGVGEVDECVNSIVETYRITLLKIFNGFSVKLVELRRNLGRPGQAEFPANIFETLEFNKVIEQKLLSLSYFVNSKINSSKQIVASTYNDVLKLQKTLINLASHLRTTFNILNDASHLWDALIMRSALAQKLTMTAVEDLLTSNDSKELESEVSFGIALEQTRTSAGPDKLKQSYHNLVNLLDKTADLYLLHSKAEIGRLEQFMTLPATMAETLLAEFNNFLGRYPRNQLHPTSSNLVVHVSGTVTPQKDSIIFTFPLPRLLLQSNLQCKALQNWENGFLESFQSNISLIPYELKQQAQRWVDEKIAILNVRYSMKMMSHIIRLERVEAARALRLAELNYHESRLVSHLNAIRELIYSLPIEASDFLSIDAPSLYPFCDWMDRLQASWDEQMGYVPLDPETERLKLSSFLPRVVKHRTLFEASLDEAIDKYKVSIEERVHAVRVANVQFIAAIKLFGEGGSYSCQEALKATAALVQVADAFEACVRKTHECLLLRRTKLLSMADQSVADFSVILKNVRNKLGFGLSSNKLKKK